jgi:hypothetical protein
MIFIQIYKKFLALAPVFLNSVLKQYEILYAIRIVSVIHVSYLQMLGLVCFLQHTFYFTTILYFDDRAEERRYTNQELINGANYINLSLYIFPV